MKVQPGKADAQSQMKIKTEDATSQSQSSPMDIFAAIINSMSTPPEALEVNPDAAKAKPNDLEFSLDTKQEKPVLDSVFTGVNLMYPLQAQTPDAHLQQPIVTTTPETATPINTIINTSFATTDVLLPDSKMTKNVKTDFALKTTAASVAVQDKLTQSTDEQETLQPSKEKLTQTADLMIESDVKQKPKKNILEQKPEKISMPESKDVDSRPRVTTPLTDTETNSTQSVNVLSLLKGQAYDPKQQKNKPVDALVQMGNFINGETTRQSVEGKTSFTSTREASTVDYGEILSKTSQPEYEMKIDLLPMTVGAQEVYKASIKIYPPELGAVIAKLKMDKKNAELIIVTENNRVKEVVESNLSQLKQQFQQADINLTHIQIEVQTPQTGSGNQSNQERQSHLPGFSANEDTKLLKQTDVSSDSASRRLDSLVDTYA
jgi:flagellar hook-length control protein FliK